MGTDYKSALSGQDRLWIHTHQIGTGGSPQLLAENTYNELGQLLSKKVGNTSALPLQKVDYTYNVRGWLTGINKVDGSANPLRQNSDPNDLFAFGINYNNTVTNNENGTIKPLFNGNIAETSWRTSTDNILRRYGYEYDQLNRLKNAVYQKPGTAVPVTRSYNEKLTYDKNGNIRSLQRNGDFDDPDTVLPIDNLTYFYNISNTSNRLMKVTDATNSTLGFRDDSNGGNDTTDDYAYDANGNMTKDENKFITSIKYNHLNLPTEIIISGGTVRKINYIYTASGEKLRKVVTNGTIVNTTDYLDGFQYNQATVSSGMILQFFPHAEGYVSNTVITGTNTYNYVFNYKDHLGNNRLSYTYDTSITAIKILEENHYYPYGMKHTKYNINQAFYNACELRQCIVTVPRMPYQYKYNGMEYQDELGLNMYAMDMRQYDPAIARWVVQDPVVHHNFSPYSAFDNNPVYWADPSGADASDMMGTDMDGNRRYTVGGQYIPKAERDGRSNTFYMGGGGTTSYGKADFLGTWVKHKVGTKVTYAKDNGDSLLEEIIFKNIYEYEFVVNENNKGIDWNDLANGIGIGLGIKQEMWGYTIAQNFKSARNPWAFANLRATQQAWRTTNTLGNVGSKMLTATKFLGAAAGTIQVGLKINEINNKGFATTRDYFDIGVNTLGVIAPFVFSGPAGWVIGAGALAYSVGTTIYDINNPEPPKP